MVSESGLRVSLPKLAPGLVRDQWWAASPGWCLGPPHTKGGPREQTLRPSSETSVAGCGQAPAWWEVQGNQADLPGRELSVGELTRKIASHQAWERGAGLVRPELRLLRPPGGPERIKGGSLEGPARRTGWHFHLTGEGTEAQGLGNLLRRESCDWQTGSPQAASPGWASLSSEATPLGTFQKSQPAPKASSRGQAAGACGSGQEAPAWPRGPAGCPVAGRSDDSGSLEAAFETKAGGAAVAPPPGEGPEAQRLPMVAELARIHTVQSADPQALAGLLKGNRVGGDPAA